MGEVVIDKCTSVAEYMNVSRRQLFSNKSDEINEAITGQGWFTTCNTHDLRFLWCRFDEFDVLIIKEIEIVTLLWRLTTHDAMVVTLVCNNQHIAVGVYFKSIFHFTHLLNIGNTSLPRSTIRERRCSIIALFFSQTIDVGLKPYMSPCVE